MTIDTEERRQLFETGQLLLGLYLRARREKDSRSADMSMMALDALKTLVEGAEVVDNPDK